MTTMVFVESNTTGSGRQFCAVARRRDLRPLVLVRDPARYPYLVADGIESLTVDTSDLDEMRRVCSRSGRIAGITSSSEYFVGTAARLAAELGLPGPDAEAVDRTRDKGIQREVLRAAGVPVPDFRVVTGPARAVTAAAEVGLPVVVKPVSGSGSVDVRLCRTQDEVTEFAVRLLGGSSDERGALTGPRMLVEEYVCGPEFSAETFDGRCVGLTTKHLGPPPDFVETGHDFPAVLDAGEAAALTRCAADAVRALGLTNGATHTELRLGPTGPMVIEVNPRLAGGMIPELIIAAHGIDLVDCVIAQACGDPHALRRRQDGHAAIRFLLVPGHGEIAEVSGIERARAVPGTRSVTVTAAVGDRVRITGSFRDRIGSVITTGRSGPEAVGRAEAALGHLTVRLTDHVPTTPGWRDMIELRSDTFTVPSRAMRMAMVEAELGDDVYREDPTVLRLEARAAALVGQQEAMFVPSGTMANLCGVLAQADRGRAVIAGDRSDLYYFEAGGPSVLGGVVLRGVPNLPDGSLDPVALLGELTLDQTDAQFAVPALICLETAHNMCGGVPLSLDYLEQLRALATDHGVRLHIDGARLFNAAVALGVAVRDIAGCADSVQFCLSKGLGAPVGSILASSEETVERARRIRKMLGGGMRQTGVLAAAGLVALDDADERLRRDHMHAAQFARLVSPAVEFRHGGPVTNVAFFRIAGARDHRAFLGLCAVAGLRMLELEPGWVRAVFHGGIDDQDVVRAAAIVCDVVEGMSPPSRVSA